MLVVVAYDINTDSSGGARRLRHVAKLCEDYGQRVQFSVFECKVDWTQWLIFRRTLIQEINPDVDSLRFYKLGNNWEKRVEHIGAKSTYNPEGPFLF